MIKAVEIFTLTRNTSKRHQLFTQMNHLLKAHEVKAKSKVKNDKHHWAAKKEEFLLFIQMK